MKRLLHMSEAALDFLSMIFLILAGKQSLDMKRFTLYSLHLQTIFLIETNQNIVISLSKVIDNTIDIGIGILRAVNVQMLIGGNMQCIRNTEMIPQDLVESRVFVYP